MKILERIEKVLGIKSRCFGSKTLYSHSHEDDLFFFNSNLVIGEEIVWYGDINISESEQDLKKLAKSIKKTIYIYQEGLRWKKEGEKINLDDAIVVIDAKETKLKGYYAETFGYKNNRLTKYPNMIYNDKKFERIKLPFLSEFESKDKKLSPHEKLYFWIQKQKKIKDKRIILNPNGIWLEYSDNIELEYIGKKWLYEKHFVSEARLESTYGFQSLDYGPMVFFEARGNEPSWSEKGYVYLREDFCLTPEQIKEAEDRRKNGN